MARRSAGVFVRRRTDDPPLLSYLFSLKYETEIDGTPLVSDTIPPPIITRFDNFDTYANK